MSGKRLCFSAIQRRSATFSVLTQAVCRRFKESILILSVPILLSSLKTQKPLLVWSTTKYTGSIHARFIKTQGCPYSGRVYPPVCRIYWTMMLILFLVSGIAFVTAGIFFRPIYAYPCRNSLDYRCALFCAADCSLSSTMENR